MENQGFRPIISNGRPLQAAVLCLKQEVEMKMSALAGLALMVGFGILLLSCASNVGPPQGGDAPLKKIKNGMPDPFIIVCLYH